ncbi:MAG TPA: polysaccharide biosynthesis tyrosine autokinase [Burkholderiaceae bacterium]|nr:polysaccharide biosynthesis tyrosine autokinase [Burkholderiaceae bacterium]
MPSLNVPTLMAAAGNAATASGSAVRAAATPLLSQTIRLLLLYKWLIAAAGVLGAIAAAAAVMQMTPIYRAGTTILVETSKRQVVSIEEVYNSLSGNREGFQTTAEFLKSRDVALRVIRQLNLTEHPAFDPRQRTRALPLRVLGWMLGGGRALGEAEIEHVVLGEFQRRLFVTPLRLSQLIAIEYESPDPELAAQIANAVAEAYIRADLDARFQMTQTANTWLNERLSVLRANLESSERALQKYRDEAGIVDTGNLAQGGKAAQLDQLAQRLVQATATRSQLEPIYRQVRSNSPARYEVPAVVNHAGVTRAREVEAAAQVRLSEIGQRLGSAHPQYQAVAKELEAARANTRRQSDAVIGSLVREYEAAVATERSLEESLAKARSSIQDLNRKEMRLGSLEREVAANRQLYQTFLSRVKETNAAGDFMSPVARVVDPALVPLAPVKPLKAQLVALGALLGLSLGGLIAWGRERGSNVLRATEDVDTKLERPLLVALPKLTPQQLPKAHRVQHDDPHSQFAELVRTLGTTLQLATTGVPHPVIGFTSTIPGEGKSTVSMNFALEQARTRSVLYIDLDLRRPAWSRILGLPEDGPGIATLLSGAASIEGCVRRVKGLKLSIMTAGKTPPNPMDMLTSPRLSDTIRLLQQRYDLIVLDTPPIHLVSDPLLIGRLCTGVVYIAKSEGAPVPVIRKNLQRLDAANVHVFGVVLNHHDFLKAERYHGEQYGYSRYGYDEYGNGREKPEAAQTASG